MRTAVPALALLAILLRAPDVRAAGAGEYDAGPMSGGMSGLVNVPTAEVLPDAHFRVGYFRFPRKWAYEARGYDENDVYFLSIGFLPRTEVSIRATVFPHGRLIPDAPAATVDRMASARFLARHEGRWPALAFGVDDLKGTRRFHSLYVVGTKTLTLIPGSAGVKFSGGYGSEVLHAHRHILHGGFGGAEFVISDWAATSLEYDSEKWNTGVRLAIRHRLEVRAALLNLETLAGGVSWRQAF